MGESATIKVIEKTTGDVKVNVTGDPSPGTPTNRFRLVLNDQYTFFYPDGILVSNIILTNGAGAVILNVSSDDEGAGTVSKDRSGLNNHGDIIYSGMWTTNNLHTIIEY